MPSVARDKVVENAVSRQAEELAAKSAEAHGAQTKSQEQAQPSKQDSANDSSREGTGKPARRKRSTKATKTQQAPPTPAPTVKLKVEVGGPPEKSVAPQANNASAPAVTPGVDFVADPEPVPHCDGFLCTFTLSRPGLVGLNKLAVYLNDLQDSGSIGGWQAKGWENAATKVRTLIGFANHADAIVAIKRGP